MVEWALRTCDRSEKVNRNRGVGYLVLGWALRPCNWMEKLNRNLGVNIYWWDGFYARVIGGRN